MFVTILTIIYLALAIFILVRFCKQSVNFNKVLNLFERKADIDESRIDKNAIKASDIKKERYQPELRSS